MNIRSSATSASADFDFLHGIWKVRNRKLNSRLTGSNDWTEFEALQESKPILKGLGIQDFFRTEIDGEAFEATTIRLFDPDSRLWSIYWADSKSVKLDVPQVGSFDGPIGEFLARDTWNGTRVIVKFLWDRSNPESPVWSQAFSADEGETWEWNWYMTFSRAAEPLVKSTAER